MWEFVCPKCNHRVEGHPSMVGKLLQCYNCGTIMTVSAGASPANAAPPPADAAAAPPAKTARPIFSNLMVLGILGVLVLTGLGLFLVSIGGLRNSAATAMTKNRMKQIGLALHSYHDITRTLPAPNLKGSGAKWTTDATFDTDWSWRVALLPYLNEQPLYSTYPFNVSWDDPNRQRLQESMPAVFAHGAPEKASNKLSFFQYFTGPGTLFPDNTAAKMNVPDGTSKTILFAEADQPVIWTQPSDMVAAPGALPVPPGRFLVGMMDGTVLELTRSGTNDEVLRQLINPSDGKPGPDWTPN